MKPGKAIEKLNPFVGNNAYTERFQEVCKTAIAALEKQILQKPVIKDDAYEDYTSEPIQAYICPNCGKVLIAIKTKDISKIKFIFEKPKFCQECGQAIEWE